jgi:hypothetical protein
MQPSYQNIYKSSCCACSRSDNNQNRREFFENRVILKYEKRPLDTSRHFGFKNKSSSVKIPQFWEKVKPKKCFKENTYLWTLDQKQFLAAILSGTGHFSFWKLVIKSLQTYGMTLAVLLITYIYKKNVKEKNEIYKLKKKSLQTL